MRVTERDLSELPSGNLRIGRASFAALWVAAEAQAETCASRGRTDWVAGGISITCRWFARKTVDFNGRRRLPLSPITRRSQLAFEELIEAEYLAAVAMEAQPPDQRLYGDRPGYVEAVAATLRWAWRRNGPMPNLTSVASLAPTTAPP